MPSVLSTKEVIVSSISVTVPAASVTVAIRLPATVLVIATPLVLIVTSVPSLLVKVLPETSASARSARPPSGLTSPSSSRP